jgi:hypothetical protein
MFANNNKRRKKKVSMKQEAKVSIPIISFCIAGVQKFAKNE